MDYGKIDRINEDGIVFSVKYKEGEKDAVYKRLQPTQGGDLTFVSMTENEDVIEDGSELVLTSKNLLSDNAVSSLRGTMEKSFVRYVDVNDNPSNVGNSSSPIFVEGNGKASVCSILEETSLEAPTVEWAGSKDEAKVVSVVPPNPASPKPGEKYSWTYTYTPSDQGSPVVTYRPAFLSCFTKNHPWVYPIDMDDVTNFFEHLGNTDTSSETPQS